MITTGNFPVEAEELVPHRLPMRLVERLVSYQDRGGVVEASLPPGSLLVDPEGRIEPVALIELIAQAYAAVKGYADLSAGGAPEKGFLVGIRRIRIDSPVRCGETLQVRVRTKGTLEGFAVAEGEVCRGDEVVASGTIKLWIPASESEGADLP